MDDAFYLKLAITQAIKGIHLKAGGPFGAVIVKDGQLIVACNNEVLQTNDPTAHAEIVAIRSACTLLKSYQLVGCTLYASCEPCPICLGAIYWARPSRLVYCATREDASRAGFDDSKIYQQIVAPLDQRQITTIHMPLDAGQTPFEWWSQWGDKRLY